MTIVRKDVFISYRRINFPWAMSIYQNLTSQGFNAFLDFKSIDAGSFENLIFENIVGRDHFIVILSQSALEVHHDSIDWLKKEIEIALEYKRNIIPIMLEGFDFECQESVSYFTGEIASLREYQGVRLLADYFDEGLERLKQNFLNKTLDTISHPISVTVASETRKQEEIIAKEPSIEMFELNAQELFERGYLTKETEEKIQFYSQAIKQNPKFEYAYSNRGNVYDELGEYKKAIDDYDKAIEINSKFSGWFISS